MAIVGDAENKVNQIPRTRLKRPRLHIPPVKLNTARLHRITGTAPNQKTLALDGGAR
jgi:hypothetical protein